jgi:F0F1-type ATP synthase assembly protein I
MSTSPRLSKSQTTSRKPLSAPMILVVTALDTTWRLFLPTLGGALLGIWIDTSLRTGPIITIICAILGAVLSAVLIIRQLKTVRTS